MNWPWHAHSWEITGAQPVRMFGDGWGGMTKLPTSSHTNLALRCFKCGAVKGGKVSGAFVVKDGRLVAA